MSPVPRGKHAPLPPGVAKVRLSGDTVAADVLTAILRAHPAVEILTGPDCYDGGRRYLTVRVLSPAEILAGIAASHGVPEAADIAYDRLHPGGTL